MPISVLIVEDHAELRGAIKALLEHAGYTVSCAEDAEQALKMLDWLPRPCMVLWDPVALRLSVSVMTRAAREGIYVATIPVGVASAHAGDESPPRFLRRLTSPEAIVSIVKEHCPMAPGPAADLVGEPR
jgi:CheY-like chemotaxis protein